MAPETDELDESADSPPPDASPEAEGAFGLPDEGPFASTTAERIFALVVFTLMGLAMAYGLWTVVRYWGTVEV